MRPEVKNALYITATWHLVVIIVLLLVSISYEMIPDKGILLDFSKEEQLEREKETKEKAEKMLQEHLLKAGVLSSIAVNNDPSLKDDRFSSEETKRLYRDMARVDAELEAGKHKKEEIRPSSFANDNLPSGNDDEEVEYHGPSVAYYTLVGRRAMILKIPAYKCINEGEVMVSIYVDRQGVVREAYIMDNGSTDDECIREQAVQAALHSVFNAKEDAPDIQYGDIRYIFIAQER